MAKSSCSAFTRSVGAPVALISRFHPNSAYRFHRLRVSFMLAS
jgi:hypothetical protein